MVFCRIAIAKDYPFLLCIVYPTTIPQHMNNLTEKTRDILMVELNKIVEDVAVTSTNNLRKGSKIDPLGYPPNSGFSAEELETISKISALPHAESALRKILADAASASIFHFLNIIDATGDPDTDEWHGVDLVESVESDDHYEFLHDAFTEAYWSWRKKRPQKKWKLDTYDGEIN